MGIIINGQNDTIGPVDNSMSLLGTVSIGGTMTIEDFTNIDSVGLVTARNGLRVTGGNVGINKASPSRYLEIGGTSNNPQIRLSNGSGTSSLEVLGNAASGQEIRFGTEASPQAGRIIYHNNDNSLSYSNTGGERLRITSGGNVQVNGGNVHIDDNGEFAIFEEDTSLAMTNSSKISMDFASNVARIRSSHNGSAVSRPLAFFIGGSEKLRIESGGFVGLGTDNPYHELHIQGSGDTRALITSGGTGDAVMMFENASGNTWGHGIDLTNNNYVVAYNSTSDPSLTNDNKFIVKTDGDVYIGNSAHANDAGRNTSYRTLTLADTTNGAQLQLRGQSPPVLL